MDYQHILYKNSEFGFYNDLYYGKYGDSELMYVDFSDIPKNTLELEKHIPSDYFLPSIFCLESHFAISKLGLSIESNAIGNFVCLIYLLADAFSQYNDVSNHSTSKTFSREKSNFLELLEALSKDSAEIEAITIKRKGIYNTKDVKTKDPILIRYVEKALLDFASSSDTGIRSFTELKIWTDQAKANKAKSTALPLPKEMFKEYMMLLQHTCSNISKTALCKAVGMILYKTGAIPVALADEHFKMVKYSYETVYDYLQEKIAKKIA